VAYDRDGKRCPVAEAWEIRVEREPEWSDQDRADLLALAAYEADLCECGFHISQHDPAKNTYTFEQDHCPILASSAKYGRLIGEQDAERMKALGDKPPASADRPDDGRRVFIRRLSDLEASEQQNKPTRRG